MVKKILLASFLALSISSLFTTSTFASGGTLHIYVSELAFNYVKDPELKAFLERNKNVVLWSSWYPDSGYAAGNAYGEYSHWHPFLDGYRDYIKYDIGQFNKDYEFLVANFLGASSHSMEDQVFDHLFLIKTGEMDGTGQETLDRGLDMVCMHECDRYGFKLAEQVMASPFKYTPARHLVRVYKKLNSGYTDMRKQIFRGQRQLSLAMQGEKILAATERFDVKRRSPWGAENYMTAPGGVIHDAKIVAAYWESLWKMLHGGEPNFVIATFPENGGKTLSSDHKTVDSNISVFFNRPYDNKTINAETFQVTDSKGNKIDGTYSWCYGSDMLRFMPSADLVPGTIYTVTMTTGIKDNKGNNMPANYTFNFEAK